VDSNDCSGVGTDAAKTFAAVYEKASRIPVVGLALAPMAAAAAYCSVTAYEALTRAGSRRRPLDPRRRP
jgi:hypothetical protein